MTNWFAVDKAGLAALTARRGRGFVIAELLANAWDAPGTTAVQLTTHRPKGHKSVEIVVEDDSPDGFTDLAHAFTLFAHTAKRGNAQQRGRFNLGEKLSLSMASEARITSTRGTVIFDGNGRHHSRARREAGSQIFMRLPLTNDELDAALADAMTFIAPVPTTINGDLIAESVPLATFSVRLPTELQGKDGQMRRTERTTEVAVYRRATDQARLYELGIPVCATGDSFDVDIRQKVPLSLERESVTDAYLRRVRAAVLANAANLLDDEAANESWVNQALESPDLPPEAISKVVTSRFGDKAVVFDPSDAEANKIATAKGYTVVHGGSFSAAAWVSIRGAGALRPAGQVTPSPAPWAESGQPAKIIEPDVAMALFAGWCQRMAVALIETPISVTYYERFNDPMAAAAYGAGALQFSVGRLGRKWFSGPIEAKHIDLLLHELGHHHESDHLSRKFSDALTMLGAKLALAVRDNPALLEIGSQ